MDVRLAIPTVPPLWREGLLGLEAAALMRSATWRGEDVPHGDGEAVLLIPGFLAGDGSLALMTRWLRMLGYRTRKAGIRANVACSETVCEALEERLERMAEASGGRVAIVGQSRGGVIAKALAVRRPDLVSGLVTLGSPTRAMLAVHPAVLGGVGVVAALGTIGVRHFFSLRCLRGECCSRFREALISEFPSAVPYVSVYSRHDGILDWRACLDPFADRHVEVHSSHCGMAVNVECYRAVAEALGSFAATDELVWAEAA